MEVKIVSTKENPLLKRKEVAFRVEQGPKGRTPPRLEVKRAIAAELKINEELVFVKRMRTMTGTSTAVGFANAYETAEQAKLIEPEYIIKRNSPEKPKEEAKE
ncbi:30S ribosomal protein S24e [Candidatus Bathyarchaeota archaeon]|nr:30S ribosomal protein S24e [Candidatus Bathyarchaeota archaeon]